MNIIRQPAPQIASDTRKSKFSNLEKIAAVGFIATMAVSMLRTSQITDLSNQASVAASKTLSNSSVYTSLLQQEQSLNQQTTSIQSSLADVKRKEEQETDKAQNNSVSVNLRKEADEIATSRGHTVAEIFAILFVSVYVGNRLNRKKNG